MPRDDVIYGVRLQTTTDRETYLKHAQHLYDLYLQPAHKVDWLSAEAELRLILRDHDAQKIADCDTLRLIDECIAAYTRRGNELHD